MSKFDKKRTEGFTMRGCFRLRYRINTGEKRHKMATEEKRPRSSLKVRMGFKCPQNGWQALWKMYTNLLTGLAENVYECLTDLKENVHKMTDSLGGKCLHNFWKTWQKMSTKWRTVLPENVYTISERLGGKCPQNGGQT